MSNTIALCSYKLNYWNYRSPIKPVKQQLITLGSGEELGRAQSWWAQKARGSFLHPMESMLWDYICNCCHFLNLQSVTVSLLSPLSQVLICFWNVVIFSLVCLSSQELPPFYLLPEVPVQWRSQRSSVFAVRPNWHSSHGFDIRDVSQIQHCCNKQRLLVSFLTVASSLLLFLWYGCAFFGDWSSLRSHFHSIYLSFWKTIISSSYKVSSTYPFLQRIKDSALHRILCYCHKSHKMLVWTPKPRAQWTSHQCYISFHQLDPPYACVSQVPKHICCVLEEEGLHCCFCTQIFCISTKNCSGVMVFLKCIPIEVSGAEPRTFGLSEKTGFDSEGFMWVGREGWRSFFLRLAAEERCYV